MSAPSPSVHSTEPVRHPWRNAALWTVFALTLLSGLVLAVVYGGSAPVLLDLVAR